MTETLADVLNGFRPTAQSAAGRMARSLGVTHSGELDRILRLPRRENPKDLSQLIYRAYKTAEGSMVPRPLQAAALTELHDFGGCMAPIPVGEGKTLPSLLAPTVLGVERSILLVKAKLREKTVNFDMPFYRQHFRLAHEPIVISYEMLSSPKQQRLLWEIQPKLIIGDEIHALKDRRSIGCKRFLRYFEEFPDTYLFGLSASLTERSIRDYWHLIMLTHKGERCPVPRYWPKVQEWCDAIDADVPDDKRVPAGALSLLCNEGETVRQGFRRRLIETPGVIASKNGTLSELPALEIYEVDPGHPPKIILDAFETMRSSWETLGGDEIAGPTALFRHATTLALGYYTRWIWPNNEPDVEWLQARKAWNAWCRKWLRDVGSRRAIDEEWRVAGLCERGELSSEAWDAWAKVKDRYGREGPPAATVWISDWLVNHARDFVARFGKKPVLVWTRSPRVGEVLARAMGVPYFGRGDERVLTYADTCVLSLQAHGEGKNLQDRFSTSVFVGTPLGGTAWEQALGRTHRSGQEADTVDFHVYLHCREMRNAIQRAQQRATYAADSLLGEQRLQRATINYARSDLDVWNLEVSGHPLWRGNKP